MVKQFSDKEQSDGSIPSAPTLEALYKTKFWNRDSYVRLNSLFEPCTNSTEKAKSKNRRTHRPRTLSSVGRAPRLHRVGRGFEPLSVHQKANYSSLSKLSFSSKIILNCLKKVSLPNKLKETKYS